MKNKPYDRSPSFSKTNGYIAGLSFRETPRKFWPRKFWCHAATALFLGGCSSTVALPWEDKFLDPGRIATQEPLEIPPDLSILPPVDAKEETNRLDRMPWNNPKASHNKLSRRLKQAEPPANTSHPLPFQIPEKQDDASISRNKQEKLPAWMVE